MVLHIQELRAPKPFLDLGLTVHRPHKVIRIIVSVRLPVLHRRTGSITNNTPTALDIPRQTSLTMGFITRHMGLQAKVSVLIIQQGNTIRLGLQLGQVNIYFNTALIFGLLYLGPGMSYDSAPYGAGRPTGSNFAPGGIASDTSNMALNAADRVLGPRARMQLEHTMDNLAQCAYDAALIMAELDRSPRDSWHEVL